jgi:hypothetical protein
MTNIQLATTAYIAYTNTSKYMLLIRNYFLIAGKTASNRTSTYSKLSLLKLAVPISGYYRLLDYMDLATATAAII